jgi:hypothetical protein
MGHLTYAKMAFHLSSSHCHSSLFQELELDILEGEYNEDPNPSIEMMTTIAGYLAKDATVVQVSRTLMRIYVLM